jgi:hypothetical protein
MMRIQKTYKFGEKTDKEKKYEETDKLLHEKWQKDFASGNIKIGSITPQRSGIKTNNEKKNRQVIKDSTGHVQIVETCCRCCETKPITPLYFNTEFNNSGIENLDKKSGNEQ